VTSIIGMRAENIDASEAVWEGRMTTDDVSGSTLVKGIFSAGDHTLVLIALHGHAAELPRPAGARELLTAAAQLESVADKVKHTLQQVLAFLPRLEETVLPPRYEAALAEANASIAASGSPDEMVATLAALRENTKAHHEVPGFDIGIEQAVEILRDAIKQGHGRALGHERPLDVARASVQGSISGAVAGQLNGSGPIAGAIVGAVAASASAALLRH
jgi:hypothetical protein